MDNAESNGIGFFSFLALIFITLKLTGFIGWSWLWVLAPIWGPLALCVVVFVIAALCAVFKTLK